MNSMRVIQIISIALNLAAAAMLLMTQRRIARRASPPEHRGLQLKASINDGGPRVGVGLAGSFSAQDVGAMIGVSIVALADTALAAAGSYPPEVGTALKGAVTEAMRSSSSFTEISAKCGDK